MIHLIGFIIPCMEEYSRMNDHEVDPVVVMNGTTVSSTRPVFDEQTAKNTPPPKEMHSYLCISHSQKDIFNAGPIMESN